jgi:hypothetical protein
MAKVKLGSQHAKAMFRQGLAELRQAMSYGPNSVEQPTQMGALGAPTPQQIAPAANQQAQSGQTIAGMRAAAAARQRGNGGQQMQQQQQRGGRAM